MEKRILKNDNPELAKSMVALGLTYERLALHPEAELMYTEALEAEKHSLGENAYVIRRTMVFLSRVYINEGRMQDAERMCKQTLQLDQKYYGPNDFRTYQSMCDLGVFYYENGCYEIALPLFKTIVDSRPSKPSSWNHVGFALWTTANINNLGRTYYQLGQTAKAEALFKTAHQLRQKEFGDSYFLTDSAIELADCYETRHAYSAAIPLLVRALRIRQESLEEAQQLPLENKYKDIRVRLCSNDVVSITKSLTRLRCEAAVQRENTRDKPYRARIKRFGSWVMGLRPRVLSMGQNYPQRLRRSLISWMVDGE